MFYSQSVARKVNAAPGLAALEKPPGYLVSQPAFSVEYFRYALQKKKKITNLESNSTKQLANIKAWK